MGKNSLKCKLERFGIKVNILNIISSVYSSTKVSFLTTEMPQLHLCRTRRRRYFKPIAFQLIYNKLLVLLNKQNTRSEESEIPELPNQRISSLAQNGLQGKLNTWRNTADRGIFELNLKKPRVNILCKPMYLFRFYIYTFRKKLCWYWKSG